LYRENPEKVTADFRANRTTATRCRLGNSATE